MTHKETIEKVIRLEKTPYLPVSLLSKGAWALNRNGLTMEQALAANPERIEEIIASTNEAVGCDIVWQGSGYNNLAIRGAGGKRKFRTKGTPDVMESLIQDAAHLNWSLIDRMKEDAVFKCLWKRRESSQSQSEGIRLWVQASGLHSPWGLRMESKNSCAGSIKIRLQYTRCSTFASELCFAYLEPFIDAGVSIISLADHTSSGDLISREQFIEFSLPYLKKVGAKVRERGVWLTVHICGNTTNRLDQIPLAGADIMSVDYKVDLTEARRILGGKIAFAGNMNPVAVMQKETPQGVAAACREAILRAGNISGYILMPGCDIPPNVPRRSGSCFRAGRKRVGHYQYCQRR